MNFCQSFLHLPENMYECEKTHKSLGLLDFLSQTGGKPITVSYIVKLG